MSVVRHGTAVARFHSVSRQGCGRDRRTVSFEEDFMRAQTHRLVLATFVLAATTIMMMGSPAPGRAGVDADVRAGVFTNADAVGVGAGILTPIGDRNYRWYANPNAEVALGGDDMV